VQITWDPDPNATGYHIEQVVSPAANPDVVDTKDPKPGQNSYAWKGLTDNTRYCFRLIAVKGKLTSLPSKVVCKTTPTRAQSPPPSGLQAQPQGQDLKVDLSWTDPTEGTKHVVLIDGVKGQQVEAGNETSATLPSAGTYCFSVIGVQGEAETAPSNDVCVPVGPIEEALQQAGGGGGSSGGGGGGGDANSSGGTGGGGGTVQTDGWILEVDYVVATDPLAKDLLDMAEANRAELEGQGVPARLALNRSLGLQAPGGDLVWIVYVDGFKGKDEANAYCTAHNLDVSKCNAVLPKGS
jgi:hypothetical protein